MDCLKRVYLALLLFAVVVVTGASTGACGFEPEFADGAFACDVDRSCPNGMQCSPVDNRCYRPGTEPPIVDMKDGGPDAAVPAVRILDAPAIAEGTAAPDGGAGDGGAVDAGAATAQAVFEVKLDLMPTSELKVDFATVDGTAKAGTDYTAKTGTLVFPPGTDTQTVRVDLIGDVVSEPSETFTVHLANATGATIQRADGTGTILDDDGTPELSISDSAADEGNVGTTSFTFAATLSGPSSRPITVHWATTNGTATAPSDFVAASGDLTFPPGVTTQGITVTVNGETANELDEAFTVVLSAPVDATLKKATGTGTIKNDDGIPTITIAGVSANEGAGTTNFDFVVTLSATSGKDITVNYATADGSATATGGDYTTAAGQLTIPAGATSGMIRVFVDGDTLNELNETFTVTLTNPSNALLGTPSVATGMIMDDDLPPTVSVNSVSMTEGNVGTQNFVFDVTLSTPSGQTVTVDFASMNGTATTANNDYSAATGTLTFIPGITAQTITVPVNGDSVNEADEMFSVVLSAPMNATIAMGMGTGTGTIENDDPVPTISIGDVALPEGLAGNKAFVFPVTLSAPSGQTVKVDYGTADGSATLANSDYASESGTLTFDPGVTTLNVSVNVVGDAVFEPSETFNVNLTNPSNATIQGAQGTGTILDDDAPLPTLSINDMSATEGSNVVFTVTLSAASAVDVTVGYSTAAGTATAGTDYTTASNTLTFTPGQLTKTISIATTQDTLYEANETFFVNLTNPTAANLSDAQGKGTINNDDGQPSLSINSPSVNEGNAGTSTLTYTVTLSAMSGVTTTVNFASSNGTATTAAGCGGSDYGTTSGTLTFLPGTTTQQISVTVNGDTLYEPNETVMMTLSGAANATIAGTGIGTGTITNDDGSAPTIAIDSVSQNEGNSASSLGFTVTLSKQSSQTITVNYATADGSATVANNDYQSKSGTVTFNGCTTTQPIAVNVVGDTTVEFNEAFTVGLSGAANATIATGTGTGTLVNDDNPTTTVSISSVSQNEGTGTGKTDFVFNVTLSASSILTVTVNFATANGTAISGTDYDANSGMLSFAPGETSKTVTVKVIKDAVYEVNETFTVNLSSPGNATIATGTGTGTITNDETAPTLSINTPAAVSEGNAGTKTLTFTVTQSAVTGATTTVNYATADNTATQPGDYTTNSGTLTFAPGETTKTIVVTIIGDTAYEPTQSFFVNLSGAVNATITTSQGTGTITNDDAIPTLSINDVSANEGTGNSGGGKTSFNFTVTLSAAAGVTVTVNWATADGTATIADNDYEAGSGTLTFNPGETTKTITVKVIKDGTTEANQTFFVNLTTPSSPVTILDAQGLGTITNDD